MFCGVDLASRIESAEAQLITLATEAAGRRGAAGVVMPVAGGFACYADEGSPMNKVVGLGFGGAPDGSALDEVERTFADRGASVQVELSNLADPELAALLCGRGYVLSGYENVLGRTLPHRRRGVQAALLTARLQDAAAAGCDLAVVTTAPGSTSQKNVQSKGFQLLYTRAVLVRTG